MENFLDIMRFRFACKKFDASKQISDEDFEFLLQSARLSPSSFGLEPTRLLVVQTPSLRQEIKQLSWNQDQITDSSHLVILTSKVDLLPSTHYTTMMFARKTGGDEAKLKAYKDERFGGFLKDNDRTDSRSLFEWSARQAYIVASSMMNAAASLKISSCPIEGFEKDPLEKLLGLDTFKEQVSLILAFGYELKRPQNPAPRLSLDELVSYL